MSDLLNYFISNIIPALISLECFLWLMGSMLAFGIVLLIKRLFMRKV